MIIICILWYHDLFCHEHVKKHFKNQATEMTIQYEVKVDHLTISSTYRVSHFK